MNYVGLGLALEQKGDVNGAIQAYRQALSLDPNFADAHRNLGDALATNKDLDGAIQEYRQALSLNPDSYPAAVTHYDLGLALEQKGDVNGAIEEYRQALSLQALSPNPDAKLRRVIENALARAQQKPVSGRGPQ